MQTVPWIAFAITVVVHGVEAIDMPNIQEERGLNQATPITKKTHTNLSYEEKVDIPAHYTGVRFIGILIKRFF